MFLSVLPLIPPPSSVSHPQPSFLGSSVDARWDLRPAPLSSQSQVHSGIFLLPPLSAPGNRAVSVVCVAAACVLDTGWIGLFFLSYFGCLIKREQIVFRVCASGCACTNVNTWICVCVFSSAGNVHVSRRIRSQASPQGTQGACHFKEPSGPGLCQPGWQRGNPVYVAGPGLAGPAVNTTAWRRHRPATTHAG